MSELTHAASLLAHEDQFAVRDGILVSRNEESRCATPAQRLLQSRLITRIYERLWRPALVRMVSHLTYATEDALFERYLGHHRGLRMLDLCCGTARASRRWIGRGAEVLAIDRSWAMLREARRRCVDERLVLVQGDAESAIARAAAFDAVICFASLHLLSNPAATIAHGVSALRKGGLFFAWVLVQRGPLGQNPLRTAARALGLSPFVPHALAEMLAKHGLDLVETRASGLIDLIVGARR